MDHPNPQELQRLVDGELGLRRARKVSEHAQGCAECAGAIERIRATSGLVRLAMDELVAGDPLEGLADRVMSAIESEERRLPWPERLRVWFGEFFRYRRRLWAPPLALAGAAAAILVVVLVHGDHAAPIVGPPGSTVLSVSFGSTVDGTVFELEDKDGSTTAVIWVDQGKSVGDGVSDDEGKGRGLAWDDEGKAQRT